MDFHDFSRFIGKSGAVSHPPPQVMCRPRQVGRQMILPRAMHEEASNRRPNFGPPCSHADAEGAGAVVGVHGGGGVPPHHGEVPLDSRVDVALRHEAASRGFEIHRIEKAGMRQVIQVLLQQPPGR